MLRSSRRSVQSAALVSSTLAVVAFLIGNETTALGGLGSSRPPVCNPSQIKKVFAVDKGFKLLLLPLSGVEDSDAELGVRAVRELRAALPTYQRRMASHGGDNQWLSDLSIGELDCLVSEHGVAAELGRAAGADAVLWGRAVCMLPGKNGAACRQLQLGFLDGAYGKVPSPASTLKLSLTLIHHELSSWGNGVQESNRLRTVDFPAQSGEQAYGALNELMGIYAHLAGKHQSAVTSLKMARETVAGGARGQAELDLLIGYIGAEIGEVEFARTILERAMTECGPVQDECQASALYMLAMADSLAGERDRAVQRLTQAFGLSEQLKDPKQRIKVLSELGGVHAALGDLTLALHLFQKVRALQEAQHDTAGQAKTLWSIAQFQSELGKPGEARGSFEQALKLYHQAGDATGELNALVSYSAVLLQSGELAQAEALLKRAEALLPQVSDPRGRGRVLCMLAEIYRQKQDPVQAIQTLKEATQLASKSRDLPTQAQSEHGLGELFQALEDHEQAIEHLEAALPLYTQLDMPKGLTMLHGSLGFSRLALNQPDRAASELEQANKYAKQLGDSEKQLKYLLLLGQVSTAQPRIPNAKERLEEGLRLAREAHDLPHERDFLFFLGGLQLQLGNDAAAVPYFQELRTLLASASPRDELYKYYPTIGLALAQAGLISDALDAYRSGAMRARQSRQDEVAAQLLRSAFDVALEGRQLAAAESIFDELRELTLPPLLEAAFKARILAYRGAPEAKDAYQQLAELAGKADATSDRTIFRTLAEAGLLRLRQQARWGRCKGAVVGQLRSAEASTPLQVGDVVITLKGQCIETTASFEHLWRQNSKAPRLTTQLWRGEKRQTVSATLQQLAAAGISGF